jgi:hypothetical protein
MKYRANNLTPNPFPPLLLGEGKGIMYLAGRRVRIKASLLLGERFGERSECTVSNREPLYSISLMSCSLAAIAFKFG